MSNHYDDTVACPKCGKVPIVCLDRYPSWRYLCEKCGYETTRFSELKKVKKQ